MRLFILLITLCFWTASNSQINHPKASPFSEIQQEVGLSKITISYSRPSAKGRTIFGNRADGEPGLVPYGRIWRVGANESTKINFDTDIQVLGNILAKGTYALYAFPEADEWEIVFHKNTTHWGDGRTAYNPEEDALRILVTPIKTLGYEENFLISFDGITHNFLNMVWHWANTKVSIPITVNTDEIMELQIKEELSAAPTAQTYYEVARYYQEKGVNYSKALIYLKKAIELGGDTYYFHRVKSLMEAELEDYSAAISSAKISLKLAEKEGKDEFVRMNQKNIKDWQNKFVVNSKQ